MHAPYFPVFRARLAALCERYPASAFKELLPSLSLGLWVGM